MNALDFLSIALYCFMLLSILIAKWCMEKQYQEIENKLKDKEQFIVNIINTKAISAVKKLKEDIKEITFKASNSKTTINSEEFIDDIVDRINRKQLDTPNKPV